MNKNTVRQSIRKSRQHFISTRNSIEIDCPGAVDEILRKAGCVAGYASNGREPDILPWLAKRSAQGGVCALPHIAERTMEMRFLAWRPADVLERAEFGFDQPPASAPIVSPDVILTPLVAFDDQLNRLGQGAGHYDRAFARFPDALRIGIAWSVQQVRQLEIEDWDVPLHMIVTEKGLITSADSTKDA